MEPISTILHPTDFSSSARHAFRLACSLARDHGARLVVLHVAQPPMPIIGDMIAVPPIPAELPAEESRSLLAQVKALKPAYEGFPVEYRVEQGDVVDLILAMAAQVGAELIVMGTHGRTGLGHLLVGSVAEQVVRKAPCSVLTVKTPIAPKSTNRPGAEAEDRPLMARPY